MKGKSVQRDNNTRWSIFYNESGPHRAQRREQLRTEIRAKLRKFRYSFLSIDNCFSTETRETSRGTPPHGCTGRG